MGNRPPVFSVAVCSLFVAAASAFPQVQLDLSGAYNYDAVGTQAEIAWANTVFAGTNRRLSDAIGQHSLNAGGLSNTSRVYVNQGSVTPPRTGLPDTGTLGGYAISQNFQNGNAVDGFTPAFNAVRVAATATNSALTTQSVTITLDPSDQQSYESVNILFVAARTNSSGNYQTTITANYLDSTSGVVFSTGLFAATGASMPGGTLGNAGVSTLAGSDGGGFLLSNDSSGLVSNVFTSTSSIRSAGSAGSGTASSVIDNAVPASLWQMANPLSLDESKVLVSLTFSVSASSNGRFNDLAIFGINATPVPEPSAAVLLLSGAAVLSLRRRWSLQSRANRREMAALFHFRHQCDASAP